MNNNLLTIGTICILGISLVLSIIMLVNLSLLFTQPYFIIG